MRSSLMRRHLGAPDRLKTTAALKSLAAAAQDSEFAPRDYVAFLLHIDAEIEHCLMVQYLYAGYSLGGPQVPERHRAMVRGWQEIILGIAKEEMGHLITVQNVLRLIGAPLNLGREDFPWDVPFYPFPFSLEPLTLDSLAKYVYAESPRNWSGALADEITERVKPATKTPHHVSELFALLIPLVRDPNYVSDSAFQADTYSFQADWAEWGRGYQGGQRGNSTRANPPQTPDVLVATLSSRDDAVNALTQIAEQGEATSDNSSSPMGPSHFVRFRKIYEEMKAVSGEGWSPARPVALNPYVSEDPEIDPAEGLVSDVKTTRITHPEAVLWAKLHNVRYRMLLSYLIHTFVLEGGRVGAGVSTPRGAIINATFGEMYNLRAISDLLMQMPASQGNPEAGNAGPPFQMPYTLDPPLGEPNRWRQHLDLLTAAEGLIASLIRVAPPVRQPYLISMGEADRQMRITAERILSKSIEQALT